MSKKYKRTALLFLTELTKEKWELVKLAYRGVSLRDIINADTINQDLNRLYLSGLSFSDVYSCAEFIDQFNLWAKE